MKTPVPDVIAVDESFVLLGVKNTDHEYDDVLRLFNIGNHPQITAWNLAKKIERPMLDGLLQDRLLGAMWDNNITPDMLRELAQSIAAPPSLPPFDGATSDGDIRSILKHWPKADPLARLGSLLAVLADEYEAMIQGTTLVREISHCVRLEGDQVRMSRPQEFPRLSERIPLIILDGSADTNLYERIIGPHRFEQRDVAMQTPVIQLTDFVNGKTAMESHPQRLEALARFAARSHGDRVIITSKAARVGLTGEDKDARLPLSAIDESGNHILHHGASKGSNTFQDLDMLIITGGNSPKIEALQKYSGMFMRNTTALKFRAEYVQEIRGYSGAIGKGVNVWTHSDPFFQAVAGQILQEGILQGMHRARPVIPSKRPRVIVLATNTPIRTVPTLLVRTRDLLPEWWSLLEDAGGLLVDSPEWLTATWPGRFKTNQAARDYLRNGGADTPWGGLIMPWQFVELPLKKRTITVTPQTAIVTLPIAPPNGITFRVFPFRSDRPPRVYQGLSLLGPFETLKRIRETIMDDKPAELVFTAPGAMTMVIRPASAPESAEAHRAVERLAVYQANETAGAARNEAAFAEGLKTLVLENNRIVGLATPISRAEILRDVSRVSPDERASCMAFALDWAKAAVNTSGGLDDARRALWLRWGPVNLSHMDNDPMTDEEAFKIATEAVEQAEMLLCMMTAD